MVTAPSIAQPFAYRRAFLLFLAAYPVLWVLGLAYFMWPLLGIGFVLAVFGRPPVRVSPGFGIWVLFLMWMLASAIELSSHQRYLLFSWRAIIYLTATALFLWVYNAAEDQLHADTVARALTVLFAVAVVGGVLGVIDPTASMDSLAQHLLPRSWLSNTTAYAYVHPALAQIQFKALGHPIGRPMAPFAYTNQWAATVGVLMPFAVITTLRSRPGVTRHALVALLALSVVPIVVSLNRGLWIALAVGVVYVCLRLAAIGYRRTCRSRSWPVRRSPWALRSPRWETSCRIGWVPSTAATRAARACINSPSPVSPARHCSDTDLRSRPPAAARERPASEPRASST